MMVQRDGQNWEIIKAGFEGQAKNARKSTPKGAKGAKGAKREYGREGQE